MPTQFLTSLKIKWYLHQIKRLHNLLVTIGFSRSQYFFKNCVSAGLLRTRNVLFFPLCLSRYGLREFVVIAPAANNDAVVSESKCNLLLSSISIALGNTGW